MSCAAHRTHTMADAFARRNGLVAPTTTLDERGDALKMMLRMTTAAALKVDSMRWPASDVRVLSDAIIASTTITSLTLRGV